MTEFWLLVMTLLSAAITPCHELVTLCSRGARRARLERVAAGATGRILILDNSAGGVKLVIEVQPMVAVKSSMTTAKDCAE
jgi:hypothetical protein